MKAPLQFATSSLLTTLLLGTAALAAPEGGPAPTLEARLSGVLGRPGGLTSGAVASRAEVSCLAAKARSEDLRAAAGGADQALVVSSPRLSVWGRYPRLSSVEPPALGTLLTPDPRANVQP